MSLLPLLFNEIDRLRPPFGSLYDQHFGMGLLHDDILEPMSSFLPVPLLSGYLRPWRAMATAESGISSIKYDSEGFKVNLDVQHFRPEEVKAKVEGDFLVIEGKHEERSDKHGFVSRQFTRKYRIPDDIDSKALVSKLSSDGVLTLEAPKKALAESKVHEIQITQTNKPAIKDSAGKL